MYMQVFFLVKVGWWVGEIFWFVDTAKVNQKENLELYNAANMIIRKKIV